MANKQTGITFRKFRLRSMGRASLFRVRPAFLALKPSHVKSWALLGLILISTITMLPIVQSTPAHAATMADGMSLDDQIKSFLYYRALGPCVKDAALVDGGGLDTHKRINQSNAANKNWFTSAVNLTSAGTTSVPIGPYMRGTLSDVGDDFKISCDQSPMLQGALNLWGNWAPDEALCAFGFRRADDNEFNNGRCTNAQNGTDEFKRGSDVSNSYQNAVKNRVYGGAEPSLSPEANYLFYLGVFQQSCTYNAQISMTAPSGSTDRDYVVNQIQADGKPKPTYYTGRNNKTKTDQVIVGPLNAVNPDEIRESCGWLVDRINENAAAYSAHIVATGDTVTTNPGGTVTGDPTDNPTSCIVDGVGWIVCGISRFFAGVMDGIYGLLTLYLTTPALNTKTGPNDGNTLYNVWSAMRNIANIAFVLAFLLIIYSQLTNYGVSNYGIKKMLPRLIASAILVNVSYWIAALGVDISNILGKSIYDLIHNIGQNLGGISVPANIWETVIGGLLAGGGLIVTGGAIVVVAGAVTAGALTGGTLAMAALWVAIPALLAGILGVIIAFAILAARQALIIILIVLSPLAFVALLLPNTDKYFTMWRKALITMLIFYPIFSVIFAGAQMASLIILSSAGGGTKETVTSHPVGHIIVLALFVQAAPLILTPMLVKFSGGMIGRLAGMVNNKGKGLIDRSRKVRDRKLGLAANEAMANAASIGGRNPFSRTARGMGRGYRAVLNGRQVDADRQKRLDARNQSSYLGTAAAAGLSRDIKNAQQAVQAQEGEHNAEFEAQKDVDLTYRLKLSKQQVDAHQLMDEVHWQEALGGSNVVPGMSADIADAARETARASNISNNRVDSAKRVQQQQYAELLKTSGRVAQRAGGIDPNGAARVKASAIATQNAATSDAIKHTAELIQEESTPDTLVANAARSLKQANENGDAIQARAAAQILRSTGSKGLETLHNTIDSIETDTIAHPDGLKDSVAVGLKYDMSSAGLKGKDSAMDKWATSTTTLRAVRSDASTVTRLNQVELAGQTEEQLKRWEADGLLTKPQAEAVIAAHEKGTLPLDPEKAKIFRRII